MENFKESRKKLVKLLSLAKSQDTRSLHKTYLHFYKQAADIQRFKFRGKSTFYIGTDKYKVLKNKINKRSTILIY